MSSFVLGQSLELTSASISRYEFAFCFALSSDVAALADFATKDLPVKINTLSQYE